MSASQPRQRRPASLHDPRRRHRSRPSQKATPPRAALFALRATPRQRAVRVPALQAALDPRTLSLASLRPSAARGLGTVYRRTLLPSLTAGIRLPRGGLYAGVAVLRIGPASRGPRGFQSTAMQLSQTCWSEQLLIHSFVLIDSLLLFAMAECWFARTSTIVRDFTGPALAHAKLPEPEELPVRFAIGVIVLAIGAIAAAMWLFGEAIRPVRPVRDLGEVSRFRSHPL